MENISGQGLIVTVQASVTLPVPFPITQFSDDADPIDVEVIEMGAAVMGLNGDLIVWSKAVGLKVTLNIIPGSAGDIALETILRANLVARGKITAKDIITLTEVMPSGRFAIYQQGIMTKGMPSHSVASEGRLKTKPYEFIFESRSGI
jgi:hypothetical protein